MLLLSKTLGQLLLPSSALCIALVLAWILFYRRPRVSRALLGVILLAFFLLGLKPVAALLAASLERELESAVQLQVSPSVIVVLSGGADRSRNPADPVELSGASWRRLSRAVALYEEHKRALPILFSGDSAGPLQPPLGEARAAKQAAVRMAVAQDDFWIEDASRNTAESATAVRSVLAERFPNTREVAVFLVTSAWHLPRASETFRRAGIAVVPVPADFASGDMSLDPIKLIPSGNAYAESVTMIREWVGRVGYWLVARLSSVQH